VFIVLIVLVGGLSVALYLRLSRQDAEKDAPSGGTGVVEGVEVDIVPRISARILAIAAEEGDSVKAGQVLARLDCEEPLAVRDEASARVAVARATMRSAGAVARAAKLSVKSARNAERAARAMAKSAQGSVEAAKDAVRVAAAQQAALAVEHQVARKNATRISRLHKGEVSTESDVDNAVGRADTLTHQVESAASSVRANHVRTLVEGERAAAAVAQADGAEVQTHVLQVQSKGAAAQASSARSSADAANAALRRAEIQVRECTLRAPRDGIILTRNHEPGEVVLPGARVLTMADIRTVRTTFFLPNADLSHAAPGKEVELIADAYPGEVFRGKILSISSKAEFTPRNVQTREDRDRLVYAVKVTVPNAQLRLRPGMPVEVRIPGTRRGSP
jgi:HlyD family secretion protein